MKKLRIFLLALAMSLLAAAPAMAAGAGISRVIDEADLLTDAEETELAAKLDAVSERHQLDVVAATVNSTNGQDGVSFTDDFFDNNGFGYGDEENGIIMLIDMEEREVYINGTADSPDAFAHRAFTDYGREQILDGVFDYLGDGDYYGAFNRYADLCDEYMTKAEEGNPVDIWIPDEKKKGTSPIAYVLSLFGGFGSAIASAAGKKAKLKTVRYNYGAANYAALGNLALSLQTDNFLNTNTRRTPIVVSRPNSGRTGGGGHYGGTTTHHSSSGRTHSSSHRKF